MTMTPSQRLIRETQRYVLREAKGRHDSIRIELLGPEVNGERKHLGMFKDRDDAWAEVDRLEQGMLKKDEGA